MLSGIIQNSSGTAGITKTGAGDLILSGANTYNGPTTVSEATLTISHASTFTNTSQISLSGTSRLEVNAANASLVRLASGSGVPFGTFLRYSQAQTGAGAANGPGTILGTVEINLSNVNPDYTLDFGDYSTLKNLITATYTSPVTLSSDASIDSSSAVFTMNGGITASSSGAKTLTLTGSNTGANTIGGVIGDGSGTMAVTKSGNGAWTLTGSNTYTGATTVGAGTLTLSGASGSIGSSPVTIAGGTLALSNTGAANNGDRLSNSSAFTMNGGAFNFNNDASANDFSESVGALTLAGGGNTIAIQQAASGRTSTLTLASLSRTAGAIDFSGAGLSNAVNPRCRITFTTPPTLTDGIIGPWATVNGTSYATIDANSNLVAYSGVMTDVTRRDSGTKVIPDSSIEDVRIIEGTGTLGDLTLATSTTTIRSLMQSSSGGTSPVTIDIGHGTNLLVNSVNQMATAGSLTIGVPGSAGTIGPATAGGNLLLLNSSANRMTNNSVIADNTSASTVIKDGSGVLRLTGANTYSGGTVINAGTVAVTNSVHLGAAGTDVTINASSTFSLGPNNNWAFANNGTVDLGTHPITLNNGAVAGLYYNGPNIVVNISGPITGNGGIIVGRDAVIPFGGGSGSVSFNLLSTGNTFTGPFTIGSSIGENGTAHYTFNSLADSSSPIVFATSEDYFNYGAGATANLSVPSRAIDLLKTSPVIRNLNATYTMTLGSVSTTTAGAKTLRLNVGGAGGTIAGGITDGNGQIIVTKSGSGTWSFSGTNTYTGMTTLEQGGTLRFLGTPAMPPSSVDFVMYNNTTIQILTDSSGTINLGNQLIFRRNNTASGLTENYYVHVANNGGGTTNSTIVLGKLDFTVGDTRPSRQLNTTGANGYSVRAGDVDLDTEMQGNAVGGTQRLRGMTAPLEITGTVKHLDGGSGIRPNSYSLFLGGTIAGNVVSGTIADADDYPANTSTLPLSIYKGDSGEWTLSGTNIYTGITTVNAGKLMVNGSLSTGTVNVTSSGTFGGAGTVGGEVNVSNTAAISTLDGAVGTLTLCSNLNINGAAGANDLFFDLGTSNNGTDKIVVTGNVTMVSSGAGVINLNQLSGTKIDAGTYDLIDATGSMVSSNDFTLATPSAFGNDFALQLDGTAKILQLVVTAGAPAPSNVFWTGNASDNNWSSLNNWSTNITGVPAVAVLPGYNTDVRFYANSAVRLTSGVLDNSFDINSLTYLSNLTANTTINGSQALILEAASGTGITVNTPLFGSTPVNTIACEVALADSQTWTVNSNGQLTVSGVISDFGASKALTKAGIGTAMLSGLNTYSGKTIVQKGTLQAWHYSLGNVAVPNALGMSSADPANLVLNPGTTLHFVTSGDADRYTDRGFTINGTAPGDSATLYIGDSGNKGVGMRYTGSPEYGTPNQTRTLILDGTLAPGGGNYNRDSANRLFASIADNGSGAVSLVKNGPGYWRLAGNCTYSGGTVINEGILRLGANNNCIGVGTLTMNGGSAAMDDNRTLANAILLSSNATIDTFATSLSLSGAVSGPGTLTKSGTGTMTMTGTNNTYSGDTIVSAGKLTLTTDHSLPRSTTLYLPAVNPTVALNLNFAGWQRITDLYIDGVRQPRGIYGDDGASIEGTGYIVTGDAGTIFTIH